MRRAAVIAAAAVVAGTGAAVITVTPPSHDFGRSGVLTPVLMRFTVSSTAGDSMGVAITGPHASEFKADKPFVTCVDSIRNPAVSCPLFVTFLPAAVGIRTASLILSNASGQRATVPLRGEGVNTPCTMQVVSCNYAHLYSGTFSWIIDIKDADTRNTQDVTVSVVKGVATCVGTQVEIDARTEGSRGTINGPGLIAVEFGPDSLKQLTFRITAACPTASSPDSRSSPASLGNSVSQETYQRPASAIGIDLIGNTRYPAPETDPVNGVSGTVSVAWSLKRCLTPSPGCP